MGGGAGQAPESAENDYDQYCVEISFCMLWDVVSIYVFCCTVGRHSTVVFGVSVRSPIKYVGHSVQGLQARLWWPLFDFLSNLLEKVNEWVDSVKSVQHSIL
jgi:hypothetical protein